MHPTYRFLLPLLALVILAPPAPANVYKERINPNWSADGTHMWYRNDFAQGRREFVLVDFGKGSREPAFDHAKLAAALTAAGAGEAQADKLPVDRLHFDLRGDVVRFHANGRNWAWNRGAHKLDATDKLPAPAPAPKEESTPEEPEKEEYRPSRDVSPDGKWRAYIHEHNVWVKPAEGAGEPVQLSTDGVEGNRYDAPFWAANSNNLVAFRVQPGEIGEVYLVESSPKDGGRAKLHTRRYAQPGDRFTSHELNWFDVAAKEQVKPEVGLIDFRGPRLRWTLDGRYCRYLKIDRGHQRLRVIEIDCFTGAHRNIIDEQTDTFIWTDHALQLGMPLVNWLKESKEILWLSEKDGHRHLYLVDIASGKAEPVTKGNFVVRFIDRVDEERRQIWFRASGYHEGQDPYLIHYFRVNFDGSGFTPLTEGNGYHEIQYSPDGMHILDRYDRVDLAPVHELRRVSDGKLVAKLEEADITELLASGWEPPVVFSAKGRDGETDIWGVVAKPKDLDPGRKYPVLEDMYAGPHDSYVPKRWSSGRRWSNWTDMGFVVVKIDGMGTANRSKAFHDVCWHNLKDAGFPDRILWMKAFAKDNPWMDLDRVGIHGGSAGGQSSTGALLFHPEFYKVAVSSCGCHDNRLDKASWNEQWMGYPVGPHYAENSNIDNAHRLRGRLLLIVGEMDRNVPPESTLRLVDALIKARKDFDMVVAPNTGHGGGGHHGHRRRVDFFRKHLMGIEPPNYNSGGE